VGHVSLDPLQSAILVLQLAQVPYLRRHQLSVFNLSIESGCVADPRLATDLSDRRALLALLDDERILRVRDLR